MRETNLWKIWYNDTADVEKEAWLACDDAEEALALNWEAHGGDLTQIRRCGRVTVGPPEEYAQTMAAPGPEPVGRGKGAIIPPAATAVGVTVAELCEAAAEFAEGRVSRDG